MMIYVPLTDQLRSNATRNSFCQLIWMSPIISHCQIQRNAFIRFMSWISNKLDIIALDKTFPACAALIRGFSMTFVSTRDEGSWSLLAFCTLRRPSFCPDSSILLHPLYKLPNMPKHESHETPSLYLWVCKRRSKLLNLLHWFSILDHLSQCFVRRVYSQMAWWRSMPTPYWTWYLS